MSTEQALNELSRLRQRVAELEQSEAKLVRTEKVLRAIQERSRSFFKNSPVGLVVLDRDLRYLAVSEKLAGWNGRSVQEHVGRTIREVVPAIADSIEAPLREVFLTGRPLIDFPFSGETSKGPGVLRHRIGSFFPICDEDGTATEIAGIVVDITERKRAQNGLLESDARYKALFENMLEGSTYCKMLFEDGKPQDFVFLGVNAAFHRLTGLKDALGKKVTEVIPGIKESNPEIFEIYGRVTLTGNPEKFEVYAQPLGMWFSVFAYSLDREHFIAVFDNITDRKRTEEDLRSAEEFLNTVIDNIPVPVFAKDAQDGRFILWNKASETLFGVAKEQAIGKTDYDFFPREQADFFLQKDMETFATGEIIDIPEEPVLTKHVGPRMLHTRKVPVYDKGGAPSYLLAISQDITEQLRAGEALRLRALQQAAIADLGLIALAGAELPTLFDEAVSKVSETLQVEFSKVLELVGECDELLLRSGIGWAEGLVGHATVGAGANSQSGYTLSSHEPVIVEDLSKELRFSRPLLLREHGVVSGISVIIQGRDGPWGVLGAHTARSRKFSKDDTNFLQSVANVLAQAIERKRTGEALRTSEERYRSLFENMVEGCAYGRMIFENNEPQDFVYLDVNEAHERLTGLKDVIGKKATDVVQGIRGSNPEFIEIAGRVSLSGIPEKFESLVHPLGIWLASSVYSTERGHFVAVFDNITDRKQNEERLRASEEKYRTLVETIPQRIFVKDRYSAYVSCNGNFADDLAITPREISGKTDYDFFPKELADKYRADDSRIMDSGETESLEESYVHGGKKTWVHTIKTPMRDERGNIVGILGIFRDISKLKRTQEERERLMAAIEQTGEAVIVTDAEGIIQYINPAFETVTGYLREEAVGHTPSILKSGKHDEAFYRQLWETIKAGNVWSGRLTNRRKNGELYYQESTISPVRDASGQVVNFVAVNRDITEHLEMAKQLQQAQKMEAIGTLAGGIAHDFNNLLQVTLGYSEMLRAEKEKDDPEYGDLSRILQAAKSGAELVQRLLTFSRKIEPQPIRLNLNRRIVQVEKLLKRTLPKMIDIQLNLSEDLLEINADPVQMEQVLMNLAVNARDAMPDGGRLTFETRNVTPDNEFCSAHVEANSGECVLLTISDTGHGMDKEAIEHIFEPFYTTKESGRGTGLGLAMVYSIVSQHRGFIKCDSEVGRGTTFRICFPAIESIVGPETEMSSVMPAFGTETILLVDDEEFVRDLGERILSKAGYRVLAAANGIDALALYRRHGKRIALVILDFSMPRMSGKACLKELLKIDPGVKILMTSGYVADVSAGKQSETGARGFIRKPFGLKELLREVRKVLDEK